MANTFQIKVDEDSDVPIWVQIRTRMTHMIVSGVFKSGEQLPTVRELASQINVNYNTVGKVYQDLERDGLIVSKRGRGSFVAELDNLVRITSLSPLDAAAEEYIRVCEEHAITRSEMVSILQRRLSLRPPEVDKDSDSRDQQERGIVNG